MYIFKITYPVFYDKQSENHRMTQVGRNLKGHLIPASLPWAGTYSTQSPSNWICKDKRAKHSDVDSMFYIHVKDSQK